MKLKSENELLSRLVKLESFALTNDELLKLFGGSETGNLENKDTPPPIVKEEE